MSVDESKLQKLANQLAQEPQDKYDSRFISVVNVLQNNMQASEIRRGGSKAKLTYNVGIGDLDVIFTYVETNLSREEIFKKTEKTLRGNFEQTAEVIPKNIAITLKFKDDISLDVVYLPYSEYQRNVGSLEKVRSSDKLKRDAIRLIKYWNEKDNKRAIRPMDIEKVILGWNYSTLYQYLTQYSDYLESDMNILGWIVGNG